MCNEEQCRSGGGAPLWCGWHSSDNSCHCYPDGVNTVMCPPAPPSYGSSGSISSSELCNPDSPYYVGDEAAWTGGCFKGTPIDYTNPPPPYERPEATCEERGDCPPPPPSGKSGACPKGKWYRRLPFFDCEDGYSSPEDTGGIFGFTGTGICYCDSDPEAQQKKEKASTEEWKEGETGSLGELMKMLPQLLMVMIVVSIIGAFKR